MTGDPAAGTAAGPRIVGARILRREDPRLLTGAGSFVDDRKAAGALHLAFCRSDRAHARIAAIDTDAARRAPGVRGVFTAQDIDALARPIRAESAMPDYRATDFVPLARGKVRHVGEPVVAVAAEDRYRAEDAAALVAIDYAPLTAVSDPEEALADRTLIHEEAGTNLIAAREFARGDVAAAFAAAALVVEGRFRIRRKTPAALENRCCLAEWDGGRQALTLHASTQVPGLLRDALADMFDLPGPRLRVVAPDVGGGFGAKASLYPEEAVVCALAIRLGRPVKWTGDRMEDLTATSQAFDEIVRARLALDSDGRFLALDADVIGDIGAYSIWPWTAALEPVQVASFLPGPYRIASYRGRVRAVATCKTPTGPYRGVGRPAAAFAMERLVDLAARRLALDPAEIRARNLVRDEEFPYKSGSGIVWDRAGFQDCLRAALDRFGYAERRAEQAMARDAGRLTGIGIASYAELTGIGSRISAAPGMPINTGTERATIGIDSTGAVTATFGIASHGQGLETTLAQIVAEELGVRPEDVAIVQGDSAALAHSTGTYASRSTVLAGGAATLAARALKAQAIEAASHLLEAAEADIDLRDGVAAVAGTDAAIGLRDLARAFYTDMRRIPPEARAGIELGASATYDPFFGTTAAATHIAEVEIDPQTCGIAVRRYVVAEDCGRVVNPMIVDGQVHGGVAQGIGAALLEEVVHDGDGQLLTGSFVDYVMPSAAEIPDIAAEHLETESPSTLGGYRGMGEGGTIGAPAAVANAVADALSGLGIGIDELPITPERLFRLIHGAAAQEGAPEDGP